MRWWGAALMLRRGALGYGALGYGALGYRALCFEALRFGALRFGALRFGALCFGALCFGALCLGTLCLGTLGCGAASPTADASPEAPRWMAGAWTARADDGRTEELWVVDGDRLLGLNRSFDGEGVVTHHELLVIDAAGYTAAPATQAVTTFARARGEPRSARFENPTHDFPRWIEYARRGAAMVARIGGDDGEAARWRFVADDDRGISARAMPARVCHEEGAVTVSLTSCRSAPEVYCAALGGELVAAVVGGSDAECREARGVCHPSAAAAARPGCETRTLRALDARAPDRAPR